MSRLNILPKWVLPPSLPSIYESESATALEMVAKVYGAMRELVNDYNSFAEDLNQQIATFTGATTEEINNFKSSIEQRLICKFNDLDARYNEIKVDVLRYTDEKVAAVYEQYLSGDLERIINQKIASGDIEITLVYDPETESLNFTTGG